MRFIYDAHLNIRHVVGKFFLIGQIFFYLGELGANRNMSGKLGMKLAIWVRFGKFTDPHHI